MSDTLARRTLRTVNRILRFARFEVVTRSEMAELREFQQRTTNHQYHEADLPNGMADLLRGDHPRLLDLKRRYRQLQSPLVDHSKWTDAMLSENLDLRYFRGDNAYIYQFQDLNTLPSFLLTAYHIRDIDSLGLLEVLEEDDLFGVFTVDFLGGKMVSRDLLDSINEIHFIERHFQVSRAADFQVLDIGAGYGRLAHRLTTAAPAVQVHCMDAVAESTYLSAEYLKFRGVEERAKVIPLDRLDESLQGRKFDLATNIHSFSECTLTTIRGWLDVIRECDIPYVLIIPNAETNQGNELLSCERGGKRVNYLPELEARGYRCVDRRPKFTEPCVQRFGISPTHYYLFQRTNSFQATPPFPRPADCQPPGRGTVLEEKKPGSSQQPGF